MEADTKYDTILRQIHEVVYVVKADTQLRGGEVEFVNDRVEPVLGYRKKELAGNPNLWLSVIHPDDVGKYKQVARLVLESGQIVTLIYRVRNKATGDYRLLEDIMSPLRDEGGKVTGYVGTAADVTEAAEIRTSLRNLQRVVDQSPVCVIITDPNGDIQYVNPRFTRVTGYAFEEVIGRNPRILKSGLTPREVHEQLWKTITSSQVWQGELRNKKKDGQVYWEFAVISPVKDDSGEITHFVAVNDDITYQKEAEDRIRKQNQFMMSVLESIDHPFYVVNVSDYTVALANKAARGEDSLRQLKCYNVHHGRQQPCRGPSNPCPMEKVLLTKKPERVEHIHLDEEGQTRIYELEAHPILDVGGNVTQIIEYRVEVTEHRLLEKQLAASEEKYRELIENALIGVYKANLEGTILYANRAMARMFGYESPEMMEQIGVQDRILYKNANDRMDFIEELTRSGNIESEEFEFLTRDGVTKNILVSASLRDGIISIMLKDISEIRHLQEELLQTEKLKGLGTLAAGIAHDFNNILGVILGYGDLLSRQIPGGNGAGRSVEHILTASKRGISLVGQLLTFARKNKTAFASVQINDVVEEIDRLIRETFPKKVVVITRLQDRISSILADSNHLHQVLLNLCVNARDAMPKGGTLSISTGETSLEVVMKRHPKASAEHYVEVEVSDTGSGMDEATRHKVFEPFFTTKESGKGTGLGLSVVYGIVENHKGFVDVESRLGKGTTFRIYLPIAEQPIQESEPTEETLDDVPGGTETILVIEDEEMLVELVMSVLESKGYKVLTAIDGEEGVKIFQSNKDVISLVLSDLGLPTMSGEEVVSRLKEADPQARIVVASGYIEPDTRSDLEKIGVKHYINKPYKPFDILRLIRGVIDGRE